MATDPGTLEILDRLIAFNSVSSRSNIPIIEYVAELLKAGGIDVRTMPGAEDGKLNLFAATPNTGKPGVLLSAHSDVVPVDGQQWSSDPFRMRVSDGKSYGRGTADMKGFVACALRAMLDAGQRNLKTPLWLALSSDEEIGCVGVRPLLETMKHEGLRPEFCIVGEPTQMQVALGHKGKTSLVAGCHGMSLHTAMAPKAVNALYLATDLVAEIRKLQDSIARQGKKDKDFSIPYSTLHVAGIDGGVAANIVPDHCEVRFELRNIARDDPENIIGQLHISASEIAARYRDISPNAKIEISVRNSYPGLETETGHPAVGVVNDLLPDKRMSRPIKVSYGTEGGLFSNMLDIPVIICGPGNMDQGHRPDEYISHLQLDRCNAMMDNLLDMLECGP